MFNAGSAFAVALISFGNAIKEITLHRWNRIVSKLSFSCFRKCCYQDSPSFENYYDTERLQSFRSVIINGEFYIEITFLFTESLFYLTGRSHRLLFIDTYPKTGGYSNQWEYVFCTKSGYLRFSISYFSGVKKQIFARKSRCFQRCEMKKNFSKYMGVFFFLRM